MNADAWITLAVVGGVLGLLIHGRVSAAFAILGGTITLLVLGVITEEQAFAGFSNSAPITVAALYVVAAAVERTGSLTPMFQRLLGSRGNPRIALARLAGPVAGSSALLNNTPIMAVLIPQVMTWANRRAVAVSRLLMPLSFATMMGGTLTLIGTSTNLVVAGQAAAAGLPTIGFFEVGKLGLPITVIGLLLLFLLAPVLLPDRRSALTEVREGARDFTVEMLVIPGGAVDGKTVEQAELRDLTGVFLVSVDRGDTVIAPVAPETVLRAGNKLRFVGQIDQVLDLRSRPGLESAEEEHISSLEDPRVRYYEVVVGSRSPLVGSTLREVGFRSYYQAAVVAIHRSGQLLDAQLGRVPIKLGDTLVLVSDPGFKARWQNRADFLLIAGMDGTPSPPTNKAWIALTVLATIVILAATGLVPILIGALVGAVVVVATGILNANEARRSIDFEVIVVIAAAFGLAAAMENSGLASSVATGLAGVFGFLGDYGAVLGIVLATLVLTEMITNNAAALLMFPIGLSLAEQFGMDPIGMVLAIAVAASMSFLTPIGYQTNTMVYGPGGYRFSDYSRLGWPLTLAVLVIIVVLTPVLW